MVTDSNAVAQEKGLISCLAFAKNCKTGPKTAGEVICLMYCEIEAREKVIDQLLAEKSKVK